MAQKEKKLSKADIQHIAWLARIELSKKEIIMFTKQINDILTYFKKLDEINTDNIPPTYHVLDLSNVLRKDEVRPSNKEILDIIPQTKGRFVKAPKMT